MEITTKQIIKASRAKQRYGLYKVTVDGEQKGFIEKAFHTNSFRVGTPGVNQQSFGSLQRAVDYLVKEKTMITVKQLQDLLWANGCNLFYCTQKGDTFTLYRGFIEKPEDGETSWTLAEVVMKALARADVETASVYLHGSYVVSKFDATLKIDENSHFWVTFTVIQVPKCRGCRNVLIVWSNCVKGYCSDCSQRIAAHALRSV